jgi:hypothetical protein
MYIGYLHDRKKLGFHCIEDIRAVKKVSDLKNFLKRTKGVSVAYIVKKGKQISILIFLKGVLVTVFIFVQSVSVNIDPDVYRPSSSSSEVYQSCVSKSDTSGFLTSSLYIHNYILKLKGGFDESELTDEQKDNLKNSILAKTPESDLDHISMNKLLLRLGEIIEPVISDQRFWKILSQLEKPVKSDLPSPSEVRSIDILGPAQNAPGKQDKKTRSKGSSIFADALLTPQARRSSLPPRSKLIMAQTLNKDSFSNGLTNNP